MKRRLVRVTVEGDVRNPYDCPVARALKRVFPKYYVSCGYSLTRLGNIKFVLPIRVQEFQSILMRDSDYIPEPVAFMCPIPEKDAPWRVK